MEATQHHVKRYLFASEHSFGRVLDAACGVGYGSALLRASCPEVVGVDKSQDAVDWAERYFPGPSYICGDIEQSPWEGRFDTVVSLETIEHIKDPEKALKAFRVACAGIFIASVPNEEKYPFKAETFANDESPHFRHYTPVEFEGLLSSCGFTVMAKFCQVEKTRPEVVEGTDGKFLIYICN